MKDSILVLNAGSSSIKFSVFACESDTQLGLVYHGSITGIGTHTQFNVSNTQGNKIAQQDLGVADHEEGLSVLLDWVTGHSDGLRLVAAGHRVVHGGELYTAPVLLTDKVMETLETFVPLAPLHQPHNLSPIKILQKLKADLPQIACFDTAFHRSQPDVAQAFALPRELSEQGIKRYGFHGLSYEYIAQQLPNIIGHLPEKVVVAHLGSGVSMCALKNGRSVATTMGFTALDGLPMGTRCGSIDAGVVLHLLNNGMDVVEVSHIFYHKSGLLGVSGISNDMQDLLDHASDEAQQAIDLFTYRIARELGSLSATLGGLDALVFTAGIGEHAAPIREKVCQDALWLGVEFDKQANESKQARISTLDSQTSAWVIPTDEEKMIALHTFEVLQEEG